MEICTVGSVRGESVGLAMVDLNGHEAGNGGHSQGRPTAHRPLFYSERWTGSALFRTFALSEKAGFVSRLTTTFEESTPKTMYSRWQRVVSAKWSHRLEGALAG